jgi:hypothetical protein
MIYAHVIKRSDPITFTGPITQVMDDLELRRQRSPFDNSTIRQINRDTLADDEVFPGRNLLLTCPILSREAAEFIYTKNEFRFAVYPEEFTGGAHALVRSFDAWTRNIGAYSEFLRSIKFLLPNCPPRTIPTHNNAVWMNVSAIIIFQRMVPQCRIEFKTMNLASVPPPFPFLPTSLLQPVFDGEGMTTTLDLLQNLHEGSLRRYAKFHMVPTIYLSSEGTKGYLEYDFAACIRGASKVSRQHYRKGTNIWRQEFERDSAVEGQISFVKRAPNFFDLPPLALRKIYDEILGAPTTIQLQAIGRSVQHLSRKPPAQHPRNLVVCKDFFKSVSLLYAAKHTFIFRQTVEPGQLRCEPASWISIWLDKHAMIRRTSITRAIILFDFECEGSLNDVRLSLPCTLFSGDGNAVLPYGNYISNLSVTVRLRSRYFTKEYIFTWQAAKASLQSTLGKRATSLYDDMRLRVLWLDFDGYGQLRSIRCDDNFPLDDAQMSSAQREGIMRLTDYPDEPPRQRSLPFHKGTLPFLDYKMTASTMLREIMANACLSFFLAYELLPYLGFRLGSSFVAVAQVSFAWMAAFLALLMFDIQYQYFVPRPYECKMRKL